MQHQNKLTHTKFNMNLRVQEGVHTQPPLQKIGYIFWIFFNILLFFLKTGLLSHKNQNKMPYI